MLYNDVYCSFLYDKHAWALGSPAREVWGEAWHQVGPEIESAFGGTRAVHAEARIPIYVNGKLQDCWFTYGLYPIYDGDRIMGVANPGREDTATIQARAALQDSEARLAQVLRATQDAVTMVNRDWVFIYANPKAEQLYGKDLIGKNAWEAFPEAVYDGSPFVKFAYQAMDEALPGHYEQHYPGPLEMILEVDVFPSMDGIIVFSRDVTERNRAAAALMQHEKLAAVGRLASSVAHEINNPLASVTNLLYLAKASNDFAESRQFVELAERELRRVSAITSRTLSFHKQTTKPTEVSCTDLFREALNLYQGRFVNSGIAIEKRKRAVHLVECFESEIRQVLSNLISNAIDAMPRGGRLFLRSRDTTDEETGQRGLALTVADTGSGMSEQTRKRIFEAFYTTKGIGGTGLGLWISKEILDRHHGRILIRSCQAPGHSGTVCTVFLPLKT